MVYETELYHYGVKGMRWGHRKASYQSTTAGNSPQRQAYLTAKANKRAAHKEYKKAFNKAYNRSIAAWSPVKKHRQANDARWDNAIKKADASNAAKKAYKDAKKAYKQTDEYKAKRAKAVKVGAAVAGTALAAYGAYKLTKFVKNKNVELATQRGESMARKFISENKLTMSSYAGSTSLYTVRNSHGTSYVELNNMQKNPTRNLARTLANRNKDIRDRAYGLKNATIRDAQNESLAKAAKNVGSHYVEKLKNRR